MVHEPLKRKAQGDIFFSHVLSGKEQRKLIGEFRGERVSIVNLLSHMFVDRETGRLRPLLKDYLDAFVPQDKIQNIINSLCLESNREQSKSETRL